MTHPLGTAVLATPSTDLSIETVLTQRLVTPVFQPIVDLSSGAVVGMEALARGPAGSSLQFPGPLFDQACAAGRLGELNMLCAERALESAAAAPIPPPIVFVNAEPAVLDQPISARLAALIADGLPFFHVLELTERALLAVPGSLLRLADQVRQRGNSIALDDVGADPASLTLLPILEPEVIKLDMGILRNPRTTHSRIVTTVVRSQARRTGAIVIAEGIETEQDLMTARELGAHWGQGWLLGRPGPIENAGHRFGTPASPSGTTAEFHQRPRSPFQAANSHRRAITGTADTIRESAARLHRILGEDDSAIVIAACPRDIDAEHLLPLPHLFGRTRSVIRSDTPLEEEIAVVVVGAGHGFGFCARPDNPGEWQIVTLHDLPAVAEIARILLDRRP
jgi:EAL domain-containing protein (putative c-di-GMP-specific phosphodiesterase class I)